MKLKEKIFTAVSHRINVYKKIVIATAKHILGKTYYNREKDYFGYMNETKQLHCAHKNISKLSPTRFYCTDCGKTFHYFPEQVLIISELIGIFLVGSILYFLKRKKK